MRTPSRTATPPVLLGGASAYEVAQVGLDDPRWVSLAADAGGPFHSPAWARLVADCYRFPVHAFVVIENGKVVAGLPVVQVRNGRRVPRWVSLPYTDECPPLVRSETAGAALVGGLRQAVRDGRARAVEVRGPLPGPGTAMGGDVVGLRHVLALDRDPERVVAGFHRSQVLRSLRRAEREGVVVRRSVAESDITEVFYGLHVITRRRQGVPVQPRRFFALLWRRIIAIGAGHALVAEHRGLPLAAAIFLTDGARTVYKFGASDAAAWPQRPNHALFSRAITDACHQGCTEFDFGRTDLGHDGLAAFKRSWGAVETPLRYTTLGAGGPIATAPGSALPGPATRLIQRGPAWVCRGAGSLLYRWTA